MSGGGGHTRAACTGVKKGGKEGSCEGSQGEALGHIAPLLTSELFAERKVEIRNSLWQLINVPYRYVRCMVLGGATEERSQESSTIKVLLWSLTYLAGYGNPRD